jgi:cell fate regulator YaaT (PSP1 superfamily)
MIVILKIFPWGESVRYDSGRWSLQTGDMVIVNADSGTEIATIEKIDVEAKTKKELPGIIRKATSVDLETAENNKKKYVKIMKTCRDLVREKKLPMKIVNVHLSFDGGKIAFAFIADSRVDFRDLVKSLSRNFQRSVRLHQIGSRDEAKGIGGFGICGCQLCCVKFLKDIPSITTEDARVQQMGHRGSERISGLCGRLKCCLGFETEQYRELLKSMPNIGKVVKVDGKKCVVTEINPLSQRVTIKFENENKKRVSVKDLK